MRRSVVSIQGLLCDVKISSAAPRYTTAAVKVGVNLGARAGTGAGTPGRVTRRTSAATGRVAARSALASATTAGATVAGAARTVHLHTNVGRLSLDTQTHTLLKNPIIKVAK